MASRQSKTRGKSQRPARLGMPRQAGSKAVRPGDGVAVVCSPGDVATLRVTWRCEDDRTVVGGLSLDLFLDALGALLGAVRRTGSGILGGALEEPEYGSGGGRYAREAEQLDLELKNIHPGSVAFDARCVPRFASGDQIAIVQDLPERTLLRLVDDIAAEGAGNPQNRAVRAYLEKLPRGIVQQEYAVLHGEAEIRRVTLGRPSIAVVSPPERFPALARMQGRIASIGFEPNQLYVEIRSDKKLRRCRALPDQVDQAITLRSEDIVALAVRFDEDRLVSIQPAGAAAPSEGEIRKFVLERWAEALHRMADDDVPVA